MNFHVLLEIRCIADHFQAYHTLMQIVTIYRFTFVAKMRLHVLVQINFTTERATTFVALELWRIGIMHQHMFPMEVYTNGNRFVIVS